MYCITNHSVLAELERRDWSIQFLSFRGSVTHTVDSRLRASSEATCNILHKVKSTHIGRGGLHNGGVMAPQCGRLLEIL